MAEQKNTAEKDIAQQLPLNLRQWALICVVAPLGVQIVFFLGLAYLLSVSQQQEEDDYRATVMIGHSNYLAALDATGNLAAVAYGVKKDPYFLNRFKDSRNKAAQEYKALADAYDNSAEALSQIDRLRSRTDSLFAALASAERPEYKASDLNPDQLKTIWMDLFDARTKLLAADRRLRLQSPLLDPRKRHFIQQVLQIFAATDLAAAVVFVSFFNKHIAQRMSVLLNNTVRFAAGEKLNESFGGRDELTQLDDAFHNMADHVTAAQDALSESERRMRLLIENVPVGLMAVQSDMSVAHANPAAAALLKEDARDLTGRTVPELLNLPPVQFEDLFNRNSNKSVEAVCQLSNGDRIPVELSVSHFDDAEQTSMLLTLRDLTDRYEAERLKQEFMAMVGHDLKMPLSVVNCFLELLEGGNLGQLNETGERLRNRTITQVERLDRLVADLADISQIESSTFSLERQQTSLSHLATIAEGTVQDIAEARQIKIEIQNMDHQIFVDPGRIAQVLTNLLVNAVKFSPDSSTITVDSIKEDKSILVRVRDQGRGVPPEAKERIFERFQQVSPSDARMKGGLGLGLGLAICKSIVSQHGGIIGVDSEPGKGSTFWFRLPLVTT